MQNVPTILTLSTLALYCSCCNVASYIFAWLGQRSSGRSEVAGWWWNVSSSVTGQTCSCPLVLPCCVCGSECCYRIKADKGVVRVLKRVSTRMCVLVLGVATCMSQGSNKQATEPHENVHQNKGLLQLAAKTHTLRVCCWTQNPARWCHFRNSLSLPL